MGSGAVRGWDFSWYVRFRLDWIGLDGMGEDGAQCILMNAARRGVVVWGAVVRGGVWWGRMG